MKLIENLREWAASTEEWSEMVELQEKFALKAFIEEADEMLETGSLIADLLETYADRMERSGLVRALSSAFTPEELRANAAVWRRGRNPHEQ